MKITFLGTGTSSGVPIIGCHCPVCTSTNPKDKRLRSSILVESATTKVVIDTGPDFRQQMLTVGNEHLDAVVYTHAHMDHIIGMDEVRPYNYNQKKPMPVYASEPTQEALKRIFYYAFQEKRYPGIPQIELNTIDKTPFTIGDITFEPIHVWHYKLPVLGFRMGRFTYITDANGIDADQLALVRGSDVLVLDALGKIKHISHYSLAEAIEVVRALQIPAVYFTHIGHSMGLYDVVERELPAGMHLSYDGLVLEV
ncbi:MAG: MBL fold metallo-hydrolase [Chitinophagaceae bacterium]